MVEKKKLNLKKKGKRLEKRIDLTHNRGPTHNIW
jgi:hypothetical protein